MESNVTLTNGKRPELYLVVVGLPLNEAPERGAEPYALCFDDTGMRLYISSIVREVLREMAKDRLRDELHVY